MRLDRVSSLVAALSSVATSVGCDGWTYYTREPCVVRVTVRAADAGADVPCQVELVVVGRGRGWPPRPAGVNETAEYPVPVVRSLGHPRGDLPPARARVTCAGYDPAETQPFSFHLGLAGCPAVDAGDLVLTRATAGRAP